MTAEKSNRAFHRQQLATWMADYELDRQLREPLAGFASGSPVKPVLSADSAAPAADCPYPAAGQIRLLKPTAESHSDAERPVYVLLMPAASADVLMLIPFSRFPVPATPREWRTGFHKEPLRVLCLWNQIVCASARLQTSWFIKMITPNKQTEIKQLLAAPNDLAVYPSRRFGPPLVHPFDPRHVYLQEERMLLNDLCMVAESASVIAYPLLDDERHQQLAAEPPGEYGSDGT
jgi:hypothetical protein